eukprot:3001551-Rhodomonas_salina.2
MADNEMYHGYGISDEEEDINSKWALRSACRPGNSLSVNRIREIIAQPHFDAADVPFCVGLCLQDGKAEAADFLIHRFALDVNEPIPAWEDIPIRGITGGQVLRHMLELAIWDKNCVLMLLGYPQLDVGILIKYRKIKLTVAGALLAKLIDSRERFEEDLVPFEMLLNRDHLNVSQVWDILFRYGLATGTDVDVRPHFFPFLRFLRQHPKTADVINKRAFAPDGMGTGGAPSEQSNTALMCNLEKLCDSSGTVSKPETFLTILKEVPGISLAGCSASGETVLHRLWKLGPAVVQKICERPEVDIHRANDKGETALDQARERAYTTNDPTAKQVAELLSAVGAAGAPVDMITVKLPLSPGETVQVRAKDLRRLSVTVDTYLQTEYRSSSDTARDEFVISHLSAGAFQRILDCFVFKNHPGFHRVFPLIRRRAPKLPPSLSAPTLLRAPQEERVLLRELLAAADYYLMVPVQAKLQEELFAWQAQGTVNFDTLVPEAMLDTLFACDYFQEQRVPPSVQSLLDQGRPWAGVKAMAQITRARPFEAPGWADRLHPA